MQVRRLLLQTWQQGPICISVPADNTAWDVMTGLCDLFDRIRDYSSVSTSKGAVDGMRAWEERETVVEFHLAAAPPGHRDCRVGVC